MSTQRDSGITFSIANDFSNFKLLELPDELLNLLTLPHPPVLELKSEASGSNAVLCIPTKCFSIRQVQTSNTLFIVHAPSPSLHLATPPHGTIRAIASCGATLELSTSTDSALPYLRKILPAYSSSDSVSLTATASPYTSFLGVCNGVPSSHYEISQAWERICAFEDSRKCFRPTATILLAVWKAILAASTAEKIDLGSAFLVGDLWKAVKDEDYPRGLFDAVMQRITEKGIMEVDSNLKWLTVDKKHCSIWIASLVLETQARADQTLPVDVFLEIWRDNIVEAWRDIPNLEMVQSLCTQANPSEIALKPELRLSEAQAVPSQDPAEKLTAKGRKWHQKFKKK